jgi:hypothetical protein
VVDRLQGNGVVMNRVTRRCGALLLTGFERVDGVVRPYLREHPRVAEALDRAVQTALVVAFPFEAAFDAADEAETNWRRERGRSAETAEG